MSKHPTCPRTTFECALLEIQLRRPRNNREIEEKHEIHHVSSMWRGVGVYTLVEIVPERSQKDRVFWEPVSWKGSVILDAWPRARPYLRFSKEQNVV